MDSHLKKLFEKASAVRKNAYAPYSKFLVGCSIETSEGDFFEGCNVENASYGLTLCAESNAISTMIAAGKTKIKQIAVVVEGPKLSSPCGACRQRINEFAEETTLIHLFNLQGDSATHTLGELLPQAFGPRDLIACSRVTK